MNDGRRFHHILDPEAANRPEGCRSVTIVTGPATLADALATGVFVLGPGPGMALIERLAGVEGVIVTDKNEVLISSGLKDRLMMVGSPPTRHDVAFPDDDQPVRTFLRVHVEPFAVIAPDAFAHTIFGPRIAPHSQAFSQILHVLHSDHRLMRNTVSLDSNPSAAPSGQRNRQ